jgi:proteic killer suppression protein
VWISGIEQFFNTGPKAGIQPAHAKRLRLQLGALYAAKLPTDMNLPGWRWHALKGSMAGRWSVSVNGNWRITYAFQNGDANLWITKIIIEGKLV